MTPEQQAEKERLAAKHRDGISSIWVKQHSKLALYESFLAGFNARTPTITALEAENTELNEKFCKSAESYSHCAVKYDGAVDANTTLRARVAELEEREKDWLFAREHDKEQLRISAARVQQLEEALETSKLAIEALMTTQKDVGLGIIGRDIFGPDTLQIIDEALKRQDEESIASQKCECWESYAEYKKCERCVALEAIQVPPTASGDGGKE